MSNNIILSYWLLVKDKWEQVKYIPEIRQGLLM